MVGDWKLTEKKTVPVYLGRFVVFVFDPRNEVVLQRVLKIKNFAYSFPPISSDPIPMHKMYVCLKRIKIV